MTEVTPAILAKDYDELKNDISLVRGAASLVQIDICDGKFVKNSTWPFVSGSLDNHFHRILNEQEGMPFWEDVDFELDLMVTDAVENFDIYTKLGPKNMIFHVEAIGDLEKFKCFLEGIDMYTRDSIKIGIALNTTTPVEDILPLVPCVDFVQVMGIEHIGFQGQDFDERSLEQIKVLKKEFPDLIVSVDGAVDLDTAPKIVAAGAERLIVGSAIFESGDIIGSIEELESL
jgi:ribulose-phosphate 3-epimerase